MSNNIFVKDRQDLELNLDASESNQECDQDQQQNYDIIQKQEFQKDTQNLNKFFAKVSLMNFGYFSILVFFTYVMLNFINVAHHFYKSHNLSFYLLPNLIALILLKMYLAYDNKHSEVVMIPLFCVDLYVSLKIILGLFFLNLNKESKTNTDNGLLMQKILGGLVLVFLFNTIIKYFAAQKIKKKTQVFLLTVIGSLYMQLFQRYFIEQQLQIQWQILNTLFIFGISIYIIYQENLLIQYYSHKIYKNELMKIFYHYQVDLLYVFKRNLLKNIINLMNKKRQQKKEEIQFQEEIDNQKNNEQNVEQKDNQN